MSTAPKLLSEHFIDALDRIDSDIDTLKLSKAEVCRETGMSRATLSRWRRSIPTTVERISKFQDSLNKRRARAAQRG